MMSLTSFLITIALLSVFLFLPLLRLGMKKMAASKVSATAGTTGGNTTTPPPVGSTTATAGAFHALRSPLSWSLLTLYGVILGIMALMLILVPTTWLSTVGDTYQTIALTMVLIGLFLLAISSGKRAMVGVMLLAFVFLAFNNPETTAARVKTAKSAGVTTIFTPTPEEKAAAALAAANLRAAEVKATEAERLLEAKVAGAERAAYDAEVARNAPLTEAAFITRTAGEFLPIKIKKGERIGPIKQYAACDFHWSKSGFGMIKILTQPLNHKGLPIEATLADKGYSIKETGHPGQLTDVMFFEAVEGDIQLEMARIDNGTNTKRPCK